MKKLIIYLLMFTLLFSFVNAALNDSIINVWALNSTDYTDSVGSWDLTDNGGASTSAGLNPSGSINRYLTSGSQSLNKASITFPDLLTLSTWMNFTDTNTGYMLRNAVGAGDRNYLDVLSTSNVIQYSPGSGMSVLKCSDTLVNLSKYNHIVISKNNTYSSFWINGVMCNSSTDSLTGSNATGTFHMGDHTANDNSWTFDETYLWNRVLLDSEITSLYNDGAGFFYPFEVLTLSINLISPLNNTANNTYTIDFKYNITWYSENIQNCSLYTNETGWNIANTTSSVVNNTENSLSDNFSAGVYLWNVGCDNGTNIFYADSNFTLTIDDIFPVSSTNFVNNTHYYQTLEAQWNITDNNLIYSINLTLPDDNIIIFNKTGIDQSSYILNVSYNLTGLSQGNHTLNLKFADAHTAKKLKSHDDYKISKGLLNDELRFDFDGEYKKTYVKIKQEGINILDRWTTKAEIDKFIFELKPQNSDKKKFNFIVESDSEFYMATKEGSPYGDNWLIFDEHWLDFAPYDVSYIKLNNNKYKITLDLDSAKNKDKKKGDKISFNSIGDLNIVNISYTIFVENISESFAAVIADSRDITLDLDYNGAGHQSPSSVILEYNGTNYTVGISINTSTLARYRQTFTPSVNVSDIANLTHRWFFNLSGTQHNTSPQSQTFYYVNVSLCNSPTIYPVVNITYFDTNSITTQLYPSNAYDLKIYDGVRYHNQTSSFNTTVSHEFCTNVNPDLLNFTFNMWNTMEIVLTNYVTKFFNIPSGDPVVLDNSPATNLTILLLNDSVASAVEFIWTTTQFQPITGTMSIFLCNPDGTKTLTDSVSIVDSKAVSSIELLNKLYSYTVTIGSTTYAQSSFNTCHAESSTSVTYRVDTSTVDILPKIGLLLSTCTLKKQGNNTVNMSWNVHDESSAVIQGCILGYRGTINGLTQIYNNCTNSTTQTSVLRTIPDNNNAYYVRGELRQNGNTKQCGDTLSFFTQSTASRTFGGMALLAALMFIAAMSLIFIGRGEGFMAATGAGFVIAWFIGILSFDWMIISSIIAFIAIIAIIGRRSSKSST